MSLLVRVTYKHQSWVEVMFFKTLPAQSWVDLGGRLHHLISTHRLLSEVENGNTRGNESQALACLVTSVDMAVANTISKGPRYLLQAACSVPCLQT